jgi:hypothetical protein
MHSSLIKSRLGVWAVVPCHILKMIAGGQNSEACRFIAGKPLSARASHYHINLYDIHVLRLRKVQLCLRLLFPRLGCGINCQPHDPYRLFLIPQQLRDTLLERLDPPIGNS